MTTQLPPQRTTLKRKSEESWYVPTLDYYIALAISRNDKISTKENLDAANGILSKRTLNYVLKPFGDKADKYLQGDKLPGELREIGIINLIRDRQIGEYLELPYTFTVVVHNAKAVLEHNADIRAKIELLMQQAYVNEVNKIQDSGVPSQNVPDIAKFAEDYSQSWLESRANHALKKVMLHNQENDFEVLRAKNFFYWWSCEEFYTYRYIDGDRVRVESIHPLQAYPIDNGEEFVEDMQGMLIRRFIDFNTFVSTYSNRFTGKQKDLVYQLIQKHNAGMPLDIPAQIYYKDFRDFETRDNVFTDATVDFGNPSRIIEDRMTFVTQKLIKILTYTGSDGVVRETVVDENYELDIDNGDISIEEDYINTIMTGYRFGGNTGLYIAPEEEIVQRRDKNNPSLVKLPYGGKTCIFNGLKRNPIPKRVLPYEALLRLFTLSLERTIAKYRPDFLTMPKSVLEGGEEGDAVGRMFYLKADGTLIYDDELVDLQTVVKGVRVVAGSGAEKYLIAIRELIQDVKRQAMEVANMNNERLGDTPTSATATGAKLNMYQAKVGSNLMIYMFNKSLEKDHNSDVEFTKYAWINGKKGTFVNPLTKKVEEVDVDGIENLESDCGIFMTNSSEEYNKLQQYRQLAFSAGQNGDMVLASESIAGDSVAELRGFVRKHDETTKEFQMNMGQQKAAAQEKLLAMTNEAKAKEYAQEKELLAFKENAETERTIMKINAEAGNKQLDITSRNTFDNLGTEDATKTNLKREEMTQKERLKDKDIQIKREQIKSNEKIAKENKP